LTEPIWTSDLHSRFRAYVKDAKAVVYIIAPYIQCYALKCILEHTCSKSVVVVSTWRTEDILKGSSELELYPFLKSRSGFLYLHRRLHAKVLSRDLRDAVISSANITVRGVGLAEPPNEECAVCVTPMTYQDQLWLWRLIRESMLVQPDYYEAFCKHVDEQSKRQQVATPWEFNDDPFAVRNDFLLSSLPMSADPGELFQTLAEMRVRPIDAVDPILVACALHDVALYDLDLTGSGTEATDQLRSKFFVHPFIRAIDEFLADRRYFGEIKEWVQANCTDVPTPRRRDLTEHVRVLFDWFVSLGRGRYAVERPNYSECLFRKG
jgi:hypothetical protein